MKYHLLTLIFLLLNVAPSEKKTTTIYLITQAEQDEGKMDPLLSPAGVVRTRAWGKYFKDKNITTFYTTNMGRSRETATYIADYIVPKEKRAAFLIRRYEPWNFNLEHLVQSHKGESILVIGHTNSIPTHVNALIGTKEYSEIPKWEFDYLYIIKIKKDQVSHKMVEM